MSVQQDKLKAIADAIREKDGTTEPIPADNFAERIQALHSGNNEFPLAPPDAKKVYATLRDPAWPPMPTDIVDHTIVFLLHEGATVGLTVDCENQYTVELKECIQTDNEWTYDIISTDFVESGSAYEKDIAVEKNAFYLLTISASSITSLTLTQFGLENMPGCLEVLYRLPDMPVPILNNMPEVVYITGLGPSSSGSATRFAAGNPNLIAYIGTNLNIDGAINGGFSGCINLIAVDISLTDKTHVSTGVFNSCSRLVAIPENILNRIPNAVDAFSGCTGLTQIKIESKYGSSVQTFTRSFRNCVNLRSVEIFSKSRAMTFSNAFYGCISLHKLSIKSSALDWAGSNFSIANCAFERDDFVDLFETLPIITASKSITITGNPGIADLTDADREIAISKGWKLVE